MRVRVDAHVVEHIPINTLPAKLLYLSSFFKRKKAACIEARVLVTYSVHHSSVLQARRGAAGRRGGSSEIMLTPRTMARAELHAAEQVTFTLALPLALL